MTLINWKWKAPEVEVKCKYRKVGQYIRVECYLQSPYVLLVEGTYKKRLDIYKMSIEMIDLKSKLLRGLSIHENRENRPRLATGFSYYSRAYDLALMHYPKEIFAADVIPPQVEDDLLKEMQEITQKVINPNYLVDMSKPETTNIEKIKNSIKKAFDEGLFFRHNFFVKNVKRE